MSKTSAKQRIEQLVYWNGARKKPSITRDVKPTINKVNTYTRDRN
jgi:hypothetical protein